MTKIRITLKFLKYYLKEYVRCQMCVEFNSAKELLDRWLEACRGWEELGGYSV